MKKLIINRLPTHIVVFLSSWISRIVMACSQLLAVTILLKYLGNDEYAIFAILTGLSNWYLLADFGVGVSLQNFISELKARQKDYKIYIVNSFISLSFLTFVSLLWLYFLSPFLSKYLLKNSYFISNELKQSLFFMVGMLYIVMAFGSVSYKILYAEHRGYIANLIPTIGSIVSLIGLFGISLTHLGMLDKLYWSLFIFIAPTALISLLTFIKIFMDSLKTNFFELIDLKIINKILRRGLKFLFFGLMATITMQLDYIILSQHVQSEGIVIYNIATKVFSVIFFIYQAVLMALWPVFSEKIILKKWSEVRKYTKFYIGFGIIYIVIATIILIFTMPYIVVLLSSENKITIPINLIIVLGIYYIIRVWSDMFSTVLQSMNDLTPFWKWAPVQALLTVVLESYLASKLGYYGVTIGLIFSYLLTISWALPKRLLFHINKR